MPKRIDDSAIYEQQRAVWTNKTQSAAQQNRFHPLSTKLNHFLDRDRDGIGRDHIILNSSDNSRYFLPEKFGRSNLKLKKLWHFKWDNMSNDMTLSI